MLFKPFNLLPHILKKRLMCCDHWLLCLAQGAIYPGALHIALLVLAAPVVSGSWVKCIHHVPAWAQWAVCRQPLGGVPTKHHSHKGPGGQGDCGNSRGVTDSSYLSELKGGLVRREARREGGRERMMMAIT